MSWLEINLSLSLSLLAVQGTLYVITHQGRQATFWDFHSAQCHNTQNHYCLITTITITKRNGTERRTLSKHWREHLQSVPLNLHTFEPLYLYTIFSSKRSHLIFWFEESHNSAIYFKDFNSAGTHSLFVFDCDNCKRYFHFENPTLSTFVWVHLLRKPVSETNSKSETKSSWMPLWHPITWVFQDLPKK